MDKNEKHDFYCDGICECCDKGKLYGKKSKWWTCDPEKIRELNIIAPEPPWEFLKEIRVLLRKK